MTPRRESPLYRSRLTRLGYHFLFVAVFAIVGGALRGFNLLLVLAGLLLAILIVQWRQGRAAIRRVQVRRRTPAGVFAGQPAVFHYDVANRSRWLPVWMINLTDRVVPTSRPATDGWLEQPPDGPGGSLSENQPPPQRDAAGEDEREPVELNASLGHLPAGQRCGTSVVCRFSRRGEYRLGPIEASTPFPFSLLHCDRLAAGEAESFWVYPRLLSLRGGWTQRLPPRRGGEGNRSCGGTSHDGEFFGLRPWQSGDHVKHIHWRTTARIGDPAVRQFEQLSRHQVCVVADGTRAGAGQQADEDFERTLRVAATLLCQLGTPTQSVATLVADHAVFRTPQAARLELSRRGDHSAALRRLAAATAHDASLATEDVLATALAATAGPLSRYDLVVVSNRSLQNALDAFQNDPAARPATAMLRFLARSGRLAWWEVGSPRVQALLGEPAAAPAASLQQASGKEFEDALR
jgi:hypothetical protein